MKWVDSMLPKPVSATSTSAIGNADRAVSAAAAVSSVHGNEDDHEDELKRKQTIQKLTSMLSDRAHLTHLRNADYEALPLTQVYREVPDLKSKAAVGADDEATMLLMSSDLFPKHADVHSEECFRGAPNTCASEFKALVSWALTSKQHEDVILIADGRSACTRTAIREKLPSAIGDEFIELWVVYDMDTKLHTDVRHPKRTHAWSCANMDSLLAVLPSVTKGQRKVTPRDTFTNRGESTSLCRSGTGVPFRNLMDIPRVTTETKKGVFSCFRPLVKL